MAALLLATLTMLPTGPAYADSGTGQIVGFDSSKCIGPAWGSLTAYTFLQLQDCVGSASEVWTFASDGTVRVGGLCMTDSGPWNDGSPLFLDYCDSGNSQRFSLNSANDLTDLNSYKCVDATGWGTSVGTQLQLWSCSGGSNQKWGLG